MLFLFRDPEDKFLGSIIFSALLWNSTFLGSIFLKCLAVGYLETLSKTLETFGMYCRYGIRFFGLPITCIQHNATILEEIQQSIMDNFLVFKFYRVVAKVVVWMLRLLHRGAIQPRNTDSKVKKCLHVLSSRQGPRGVNKYTTDHKT